MNDKRRSHCRCSIRSSYLSSPTKNTIKKSSKNLTGKTISPQTVQNAFNKTTSHNILKKSNQTEAKHKIHEAKKAKQQSKFISEFKTISNVQSMPISSVEQTACAPAVVVPNVASTVKSIMEFSAQSVVSVANTVAAATQYISGPALSIMYPLRATNCEGEFSAINKNFHAVIAEDRTSSSGIKNARKATSMVKGQKTVRYPEKPSVVIDKDKHSDDKLSTVLQVNTLTKRNIIHKKRINVERLRDEQNPVKLEDKNVSFESRNSVKELLLEDFTEVKENQMDFAPQNNYCDYKNTSDCSSGTVVEFTTEEENFTSSHVTDSTDKPMSIVQKHYQNEMTGKNYQNIIKSDISELKLSPHVEVLPETLKAIYEKSSRHSEKVQSGESLSGTVNESICVTATEISLSKSINILSCNDMHLNSSNISMLKESNTNEITEAFFVANNPSNAVGNAKDLQKEELNNSEIANLSTPRKKLNNGNVRKGSHIIPEDMTSGIKQIPELQENNVLNKILPSVYPTTTSKSSASVSVVAEVTEIRTKGTQTEANFPKAPKLLSPIVDFINQFRDTPEFKEAMIELFGSENIDSELFENVLNPLCWALLLFLIFITILFAMIRKLIALCYL